MGVRVGSTTLPMPRGGGPELNEYAQEVKVILETAFSEIGGAGTGLLAANNLSDLISVATARINLGLGTAAIQNIGTSGANVPLLSAANTFSALLAASLGLTVTGAGIVSGAPTGGDKGAGTVNATALYVNGVALSSGVFTASYDSGDQTITAGGALTLTHGLGATPKFIVQLLHNVTAEAGYSIGDFVFINPHIQGTQNPTGRGCLVVPTSTQLVCRFGSDANTIGINIKNTGAAFEGITNANWKWVVRAYS